MGAFLGKSKGTKKKKTKITDHDRAVLDLKVARDRLKRYQKKAGAETDRLQAQALMLVKEGRKDKALLMLKIKKYKQQQVQKADGQLLTVMEMIDTIEWETEQMKVFDALKAGNAALDKLHSEMPIEAVEELMADTAESIAMEQEISRAIGGSWTEADEDDLLKEFDALQDELGAELGQELPEAPQSIPEEPRQAPREAARADSRVSQGEPAAVPERVAIAVEADRARRGSERTGEKAAAAAGPSTETTVSPHADSGGGVHAEASGQLQAEADMEVCEGPGLSEEDRLRQLESTLPEAPSGPVAESGKEADDSRPAKRRTAEPLAA